MNDKSFPLEDDDDNIIDFRCKTMTFMELRKSFFPEYGLD